MDKNKAISNNDDLKYLDNSDDQYLNIVDNVEINKISDSETTDLLNFRVINPKNAYPTEKDNNIY